jgi:TonB-linked SusC/RagA family outer membrane protein
MGGYESNQFKTTHFNLTGNEFPVDVAWSMNLATGSFNSTDRQNRYKSRLLSMFGRFNYNFNEKYLVEANLRRDASAPAFGPSNVWGVFPSFSAGWIVSNENFFQGIPYITTLKLRGSTGRLGSDAIPGFVWLKTYTSQFDSYAFDAAGQNRAGGFFISRFPNEEVKWEEVNMHDIGLDLTAFQSKLRFSFDYYIKDTKDLLYSVPIPTSVGIAVHNQNPVNPAINIGTMRNRGVDLELGYTSSVQKFDLNVSGNTSFMKNELKTLGENGQIIGGGAGVIGGMTRTMAGLPVSSFYGYQVQQILNSAEDVYAINTWAPDGIYQEASTGAGDFMYRDINGDGEITVADRVTLGNPWPKMTYAFNIGVVYNKSLDLSLQFQGVQGVDVFNANKAYARNFYGDYNTTTDIFEAWTPEDHTKHPRNIGSDPNGNFSRPSSYFIEDGSYLKLRNAQIGYNFPTRLFGPSKISGIRVFVNANNILTFTKYSGLDPEIAGSNLSRGIDYGMYPQVRTVSGGLEVKF